MQFSQITDGLRNVIANLGTGRDKASHSFYVDPSIDDAQLAMMYRGGSIAAKIVDMPAQDSFREWREWQASTKEITAIEAEEKRLGLRGKLVQAKTRARLFGGAVIYIGTTDTDPTKPLAVDRIRKGGIKYLSVMNKNQISAGAIQNDPRFDGYGSPVSYMIGTETIHPSRVVVFKGKELPDDIYAGANLGWGDPVLTACLTDVRNLDATIANVAALVFEAKIDVLGIKNFNDDLRQHGAEYEKLVNQKLALTALGKGVNGMFIKDADDSYEQKSASFATLPDVINSMKQMVSASCGIPMFKLFEKTSGGIGDSSSSEERGYYDMIKAIQTLENEPAMAILDECLIRSALGDRPKDIHYNWRPLWQPTTKEKADTGKVIADTFKVVFDMDVLPPEALANAIVNGLTESGLAPGLEADVTEYFVGEKDDTDGLIEGEDAE